MRKLLLATVAVLGATVGIEADAYAQAFATPATVPTPGTVSVRLNGRVRFYAFAAFDRDFDNNTVGSPAGIVNGAGVGPLTGYNKQSNYGFAEYGRLFPGFDGIAANGLKYGASLEIRQDNGAPAGGGVFNSISVENRARSALYFRRVWGYLGSDKFGTIRMGATDGPSSLYMTGNYENFNDGGLNGDAPGFLAFSSTTFWPFADVGSMYTTNKVVYLSPQIFGFDAGIAYEPSTANLSGGNGCTSAGTAVGNNFINAAGTFVPALGANGSFGATGPGCDRLAASPNNAESGRRRNTFDGLIRYRGSFGGFGLAATAGYIGGSNVKDNSGLAFNLDPRVGGLRPNYDGLSVGDFGVALTFGGLSVGGKYQVGRYTGFFNLLPKGLPSSEAFLVGASYTMGPVVVGAHYLNYHNVGDFGNAFQGRGRVEQGLAAGGTYSLAPGVALFLSYIYNERKQNGYNFVTGQGVTPTNPGGNPFSNKVTSQVISIGTGFSW